MSDQPNKEELSTTVPERLNKEEMYAKYGPYIPEDEWDRLKGKAPKMQQPYPLTQFPGVPDDMQQMFSLTSLRRTPEKNLHSLEVLNGYKAMGVIDDQYVAPDLEPQAAITTGTNLANMNLVAQNRINEVRLSRKAAANLVEFNLQNKPEEYAKFAEAREQIGKAAKYYGTPEEVVQQATSNYLYNRYASQLNDEAYGHVSLAYLASPVGKAATPEDLKILRELAISQNEDIRSVARDSWFFSKSYNMQKDIMSRLEDIDKNKPNSQKLRELHERSLIYQDELKNQGTVAGIFSAAYQYLAFLPQDVLSMFEEKNYSYTSSGQQFLIDQLNSPYIQDVNRAQQALGGVKLFETLNLESTQRDNAATYIEIAAKTGKSYNQVVQESKDNFDRQLALKGAISMVSAMAAPAGEIGKVTALPFIENLATNKASKALMLTTAELGADAMVNATASSPLEGALEVEKHRLNTANGLESEYKSLAGAFAWGMTNNFIGNMVGGAVLGSPFVARDIFNWGKAYQDVARVNKTFEEAAKIKQLSTMDSAPEATKKSVSTTLKQQGYGEKNVYFYPEDLQELRQRSDIEVSPEQEAFIFGDLDKRLEQGRMVILSREDLAQYISDTPLEEPLKRIARDRATAASQDELETLDADRQAYLNEIAKENPELATNTPEEREAAKQAAYHELSEQIVSVAHDRIASLSLDNLSTANITYAAREIAGLAMTLVDEYNLPIADAKAFFQKHMPTFGKRQTVLDVESGRAADKVRGSYDPEANVIELSDNADINTLIHELSHYYLDLSMKLSDEFPTNEHLTRMKEVLYSGFVNDDASLLTEAKAKKWSEVDPALKERMQETFAYEYLKMRVERAFSPEDYTALNRLDAEGKKTGRTFAGLAHFDRILAATWAKFFGRDINKMKDAQKKEEIKSTMLDAQAAFERDYGIAEIPDAIKVLASMVDSATMGFADMHRVANLFPVGDNTIPEIPGLDKATQQRLKRTYELVFDEFHAQLRLLLGAAGREEVKNMDKIYQARKKDIERNPEYKTMLKETKEVEATIEEQKKQVTTVETNIDDFNLQLESLYAKRDYVNNPDYRKERGSLKRRVTYLNKTLGNSANRLDAIGKEYHDSELKFAENGLRNTANREAYNQTKVDLEAAAQRLEEVRAKYDELKRERENITKHYEAGLTDKVYLDKIRRDTKNQGDVVRRAQQKQMKLEEKLAKAEQDYIQSSTERELIKHHMFDLTNEAAEITTNVDKLSAELVEKQGALGVDPVADINAQIKVMKENITNGKQLLRERQKALRESEKRLKQLRRQYKDVEGNYYRELGELEKMFGTAQQQMDKMRELAAENLDDPNNDIGKLYQDAVFWKQQLDALNGDMSNPLWNDAMEHFGSENVESLKDYLNKWNDRDALIEDLAAEKYSYVQRLGVTQDMIDRMMLKTGAKIFKVLLGTLDGSYSKALRDGRKVVRYTAKQFRAAAGQLRYGNVSPQQFMHRSRWCYEKGRKIITQPSKYPTPEDMVMDAYKWWALGEYYAEIAQTGVRMKQLATRELDQLKRELNAKGVADRISAEHVAAAKAILGRMGVMRGSNAEALLRQIKQDFPEQWARVAPFFEGTANRNVQHYSQMQLGDIFAMVDLAKVIVQNGKQALSDRKIAEAMEMGKQAQAVREAIDPLFQADPKKAAERDNADAVNKPKDSQLKGWRRVMATIRHWFNSTMTMQAICEQLDGGDGGPFKKNFYDPISEANSRYIMEDRALAQSLKPFFEKAKELFNPNDKSLPNKIVWKDKDGNDINIVSAPDGNIRKALVGLLIHIGNDSNLNALCRSLNIEPDMLIKNIRQLERDGIINTDLMDHVQAYWDAYKPIGIKAQGAYNEINNRFFKPVEGRKLIFGGKEYAGGYAPLTRQRDALKADASLSEQLYDASHDLPPSYDPTFAQERSESSALPLDLSYDGIMNGLSRQLRYANLMPALNKVNNFAKHNPQLMREIEILVPGFKDEIFLPWMRAVANQSSSDIRTNEMLRMLGAAGARINQSIMALNVSNAAQQVTGLIVATAKVSPGALLSSIVKPMKRQEIFALSNYMRSRMENADNMSSLRRNLMTYGKYSEAKNFLDDHAYILQTIVQNWVDQRIWSGKYKEMLKKTGSAEEAAKAADQAVRVTQGSFNLADTSAFDRSPISKVLIPFMNYFQSMGNLYRARITQLNRGVNSRALRAMNHILLAAQIMFVPSLVAFAIAQAVKGYWFDADEDDAWMFMTDAGASAVGGGLSSINPLVGQAFTLVYNSVMDKPTSSSLINSPLATLVPSAIKSASRIITGDFENLSTYDANNVLHVFNAMGMIPSLGSAAATRAFVAGTLMGAVGDAEPNGFIDASRAVITGSMSEAQKGNR